MTFLQGIGYLIIAAVIGGMVWLIGWGIWALVFRDNTPEGRLGAVLYIILLAGMVWMVGGFENVRIGFPQGTE